MAQLTTHDPCAPPPPRCHAPIEQPFKPGISTRHSPRCDGELCSLFACGGGNWRVTSKGTLDRSHWIEGWVLTQLLTRGFVNCDEHPLGKNDGGWWADSYRKDIFASGSKLWSLQWAKVTNEALLMAKQYALEALQYLITWGIASAVEVVPTYLTRSITNTGPGGLARSVILLQITVTGPGVSSTLALEGQALANSDWLWKEYVGVSRYG